MTPCRLHGCRWRWLIGSAHAHPSTTRYQRSITPMYHKLTRARPPKQPPPQRRGPELQPPNRRWSGTTTTNKQVGGSRATRSSASARHAGSTAATRNHHPNQPIRQTHPETPFRGGVGVDASEYCTASTNTETGNNTRAIASTATVPSSSHVPYI